MRFTSIALEDGSGGSGADEDRALLSQVWMLEPVRPALVTTMSMVELGEKETADLKPMFWEAKDVVSVGVNWTLKVD